MTLNKKDVAKNLRLFGYKKFGTMKKFAQALNMNPSTLYSGYLNGRSLPGPVLLVKLLNLGCNINWLLTGRETPIQGEEEKEYIAGLEKELNMLKDSNTMLKQSSVFYEKKFEVLHVAREIL